MKGWLVNISGCVGHMVSITATQLCHCSMKAVTDNTQMNEHGYIQQNFIYGHWVWISCDFHMSQSITLLILFSNYWKM